jgi:hypothetical protein
VKFSLKKKKLHHKKDCATESSEAPACLEMPFFRKEKKLGPGVTGSGSFRRRARLTTEVFAALLIDVLVAFCNRFPSLLPLKNLGPPLTMAVVCRGWWGICRFLHSTHLHSTPKNMPNFYHYNTIVCVFPLIFFHVSTNVYEGCVRSTP